MKRIDWSPTRLKIAEECLAKYYYQYLDRFKHKLPANAATCLGDLFHSLMYSFYNEDGSPYFKSETSFAGAAWGRWLSYTESGLDKSDRPIIWNFKGQRFAMKQEIQELAVKIYKTYSPPNIPRPVKREHTIKLEFEGRKLNGTIDAILPWSEKDGLVIVDYKTDKFDPRKARLQYDPQFGMYLMLVGLELLKNPAFAKEVNFPEEELEKITRFTYFLTGRVSVQFDHLRSGTSYSIERAPSDIELILASIDDREFQITSGNFVRSRGEHCIWCPRKIRCDDDLVRNVDLILPGQEQLKLFATDRIPKSRKRPQRIIRFPKN